MTTTCLPIIMTHVCFTHVAVRVLRDMYKYQHVCNESTVSYVIRL